MTFGTETHRFHVALSIPTIEEGEPNHGLRVRGTPRGLGERDGTSRGDEFRDGTFRGKGMEPSGLPCLVGDVLVFGGRVFSRTFRREMSRNMNGWNEPPKVMEVDGSGDDFFGFRRWVIFRFKMLIFLGVWKSTRS